MNWVLIVVQHVGWQSCRCMPYKLAAFACVCDSIAVYDIMLQRHCP